MARQRNINMLVLVFFHFMLLACGMDANNSSSESCKPGTDLCIPTESNNQSDTGEKEEADEDPSVFIDDKELNNTCVPGAQVRTYTKRCVCSEKKQFEPCVPIKAQLQIARKGRIVGGHKVNIGSNPYMLAFEFSGELQCGATIIAPQWAITAAHCFDGGYLPFMYIMKLRGYTSKLEQGGFLFNVVKIIIHEKYNESSGDYHYQNDIALLKVHKSFVRMSRSLLPAKLPKSNNRLPSGTMMTILGWGFSKEDGKVSEYLQEVQVPLVSKRACQNALGKKIITARMLCAGFPEGNKDACQADSGGPLLLNHTLIGIVSFGEGCARKNLPGVYTKISAFRDWIDKHIGRQ